MYVLDISSITLLEAHFQTAETFQVSYPEDKFEFTEEFGIFTPAPLWVNLFKRTRWLSPFQLPILKGQLKKIPRLHFF